MNKPHKNTEIPEPNASHDNLGWRRRGDQRNNTVTAIAVKLTPKGQRTTDHTDVNA